MTLVDVDRDDREREGSFLLELAEEVEEAVRVLAAAHGDEHAVSCLEQAEIGASARHLAEQTVFEAVHRAPVLSRIGPLGNPEPYSPGCSC